MRFRSPTLSKVVDRALPSAITAFHRFFLSLFDNIDLNQPCNTNSSYLWPNAYIKATISARERLPLRCCCCLAASAMVTVRGEINSRNRLIGYSYRYSLVGRLLGDSCATRPMRSPSEVKPMEAGVVVPPSMGACHASGHWSVVENRVLLQRVGSLSPMYISIGRMYHFRMNNCVVTHLVAPPLMLYVVYM